MRKLCKICPMLGKFYLLVFYPFFYPSVSKFQSVLFRVHVLYSSRESMEKVLWWFWNLNLLNYVRIYQTYVFDPKEILYKLCINFTFLFSKVPKFQSFSKNKFPLDVSTSTVRICCESSPASNFITRPRPQCKGVVLSSLIITKDRNLMEVTGTNHGTNKVQ